MKALIIAITVLLFILLPIIAAIGYWWFYCVDMNQLRETISAMMGLLCLGLMVGVVALIIFPFGVKG